MPILALCRFVGACTAAIVLLSASAAQAAISLSFSTMNVSCNGGSNGRITVTATGGVAPYSYAWSPSGGTGATTSGLSAGAYSVTVTDSIEATATGNNLIVTQPTALTVNSQSQTNIACFGGATGAASVSPSGGTPGYSYAWSPSGGTNSGATGLSAGTYTVTITDANSCSTTRNFTLTQPTNLVVNAVSQTNVSCNSGSNGVASASATGGTPGYTYSWSPSGGTGATASGLAAGTYTVTVTDANGCSGTQNFPITEPAALVATPQSQTNVSCFGGSNGAASAAVTGGTPSYTYAWTPSGGTAATTSGRTAGTYTLTVTDANGCTDTQGFTITQPAALVAAAQSQTNISCNGAADGSATVSASGGAGGFTYAWSPSGGTAATASSLAAGTYTVTVSDANTCSTTQGFTLTEPTAIVAIPSHTNVSCRDGSNGTASVAASGGTGTLTYSWDSGQSTSQITGIAAGTYDVTVTDANSCETSQSIVVTEPAQDLTASIIEVTNATCNGDADGTATVSATGGTPGYTYTWSPEGGTNAALSAQGAGTYTVTVTDANGCTATNNASISEPAAITVSLLSSTPDGCGDVPGGSLTATVAGGNGGYSYDWSPGEPTGDGTASISGLSVGTYALSVEDTSGCTGGDEFDVVFADDAAPVAVTQSLSVVEDESVAVVLTSTYSGCQSLVYEVVSDPLHGELTGTLPSLTYQPDADYVGSDTFSFRVSADDQVSAIADIVVTVTAAPVEEPVADGRPVAASMTVTTDIATPITFSLSGSDPESDALTYTVLGKPQFGSLSGSAPLLTYTPTATNAYEDQFIFVVNDGASTSSPATVLVRVGDMNAPGEASATPDVETTESDGLNGCNAMANSDIACFGVLLLAALRSMRRKQ